MPQLVRPTPRISINQLAKYLISTSAQHPQIVRNQKHPPTFMVNWYEFATNCIIQFILENCTDENILLTEIDRLYSVVPSNEYEETRYRTNAEALESFCNSYDRLDLDGLTV